MKITSSWLPFVVVVAGGLVTGVALMELLVTIAASGRQIIYLV